MFEMMKPAIMSALKSAVAGLSAHSEHLNQLAAVTEQHELRYALLVRAGIWADLAFMLQRATDNAK